MGQLSLSKKGLEKRIMPEANFEALRVVSLEARRSLAAAELIRTYGAEPLSAPAIRKLPLDSNRPVLEFADDLMKGAFDLVIFTTGVGVHHRNSVCSLLRVER
jgi:uroporphyrinogen-III synthase